MKLNWKWIGIGVGGFVGVLVLAVVLFIAFFPKELAAREAERRIEEATGRDLVLGNNIEISFWPALGFSVDNASLSNPADFETAARRGGVEAAEAPFISANRIVFAVKIMPLLRGAIEVKELIFEGAQVNMVAKEDGANNWTFPTEDTAEDQTTLVDLRLDDVRLVDGTISFQGAEGEPPLVLEDVDASLALESLDAPARLQAALDYRGERMTIDSEIALPRAVLEKGQTPVTAHVTADPLEASFDGSFNSENGALQGGLEARGSSLRRLLAWMGSPMGEGRGFGNYSLNAQMAREGETTALTNAAIRLDNINATGNLTLLNQESGRLRVTGTLSAPAVDLNTYLPAPAQQGADGVAVNTAWSNDPLDLTGLRALDANLDLTLGTLQFQRMSFSNVALALRVANGAADARLTRISLYDGGGTARLIADGSGSVPRIAVELNAQNIQAETLLRDAIGFDRIAGRGRLTASLVGQGVSQAAIMRSLRGNASFNFNDGELKGVNLAQVARTVQAALSGQAVGTAASTDFAELSSTFTVADGVMATDNLKLLNPFVRLDGQGLVNVGAQTIDMRIAPRAVNNAQGQGGDASIAGLGVPFRITGPWSRVQFRVAIEEVVQNQLRDILSRQGEDNPLGRLGDALFGRQPATTTTPPAEGETAQQQPADGQAQQPAQQPAQPERPRNPLQDIFNQAIQRGQKQEDPATTTPAPTP
ncbi:MAG: AsmA family protein [Caulobacteraceae bacterium]|nr:AsmA family protein [Caulobacteraceae bacterium]